MNDNETAFGWTAKTNFERVEFLRDSALLKGKVYKPINLDQCKGIVIFTHGLGYCDRQYDIDGKYFADNNYLMLTYNLRGHAGTPGEWTLQNSVDDLITAIDFLVQKYNFANKERICVIGHSTGALITLLASLKDKRIKFGSVVTTVTCLTDSYLHWFKSGFNQEVKEFFKSKGVLPPIIEKFMDDTKMIELYRQGKIPKEELEIPHRYGLLRSESWNRFFHEIAYSTDVIKSADQFTLPLLLFRGEYDEIMDVQKTNELYERLNKKIPSKLYVTNSKNHFHNDRWGMIQSETMKFFDEFCDFSIKRGEVKSKEILIVDDDPLFLKSLRKFLVEKHQFANVMVSNNGVEALSRITELKERKNKTFDLIITDIRMPGLDGIGTIRRMREIVKETGEHKSAVIFMTGYADQRAEEEAKALGYIDYLHKPFDNDDFIATIEKNLK